MARHLSPFLILLLIFSLLSVSATAQEFSASEWRRLSGYPSYVWDVEFSPQGTYFALTANDNTTELYNWDWQRIWGHRGGRRDEHHHAGALAFSPDEQYLAIGAHGERNEIAILRLTDLRVIQDLKGHSDVVRSVSFSPDGSYLASGSEDKTVRIWRHTGSRFTAHQILRGHSDAVWSVHFDPTGDYLASGSHDRSIRIWRQANRRLIFHQALHLHTDCVMSVRFDPDGNTLAGGSYDETVSIWRHTGDQFTHLQTLTGHIADVWDVNFSPDGSYLASSGRDQTIKVWRYNGGQFSQAQTLRGHQNGVNSVSFSPDGSYFASGSADKTVRVWRVERMGDKPPQAQPRPPGLTKALDFEVQAFNGELLSLKKYRGKVILLDFWATWCEPCLVEMPNVKRIYKKYKDRNFQIIGISLDTNRSRLRSYLRRERITWPQFFDGAGWDNSVAQRYGINSIPQTYLIDGNGFIRKDNLRGRALEVAVAALVEENSHRKNFRKVRRKR